MPRRHALRLLTGLIASLIAFGAVGCSHYQRGTDATLAFSTLYVAPVHAQLGCLVEDSDGDGEETMDPGSRKILARVTVTEGEGLESGVKPEPRRGFCPDTFVYPTRAMAEQFFPRAKIIEFVEVVS
jgi:hypothetical protein